MRRDARDAAFSNLIRARDKWTCQKCSKQYPEQSQGLHCAHIFSRRCRSVRWDEDNAFALCFSCHLWAHGNPTLFAEWVLEKMGKRRYEALKKRAMTLTKQTGA